MWIEPFEYAHPVEMHFGIGKLNETAGIAARFGSRGILVIDAYVRNEGYIRELVDRLTGTDPHMANPIVISGEPDCDEIDAEVAKHKVVVPDFIVALGGGSTIDFAKAMSVGLINEGSVWEYTKSMYPRPRAVRSTLPLIAVPTTAGSGSEMSSFAVIANRKYNIKSAIVSSALYPQVAVVDPRLSATVPPGMRMMVALDALAHGFENYLNVGTVTEIHRVIGIEATRRIAPLIDTLGEESIGEETMLQVALGSSLAGWSNAVGTTGAGHAIAQSLAASIGLFHSVGVSLVLPEVLDRTWPAIPEVFSLAAPAFGVKTSVPTEERCRKMVCWWRDRYCYTLARKKLAGIPWSNERTAALAEHIVKEMPGPLARHPIRFGLREISEIIDHVLSAKSGFATV